MRELTKFSFCVVLVIFSNFDATKCNAKSKRTLLRPIPKKIDERRYIDDDSPSSSDDHKLTKMVQDKKLRALRPSRPARLQMDNVMFYVIGAAQSTLQAFLFQLQTLMQIGFIMLAGLGLRSFLNRGPDGATNRVLQEDNAVGTVTAPPVNNIPAFRPIDIVSFNRFPNDLTGFVSTNFNPISSSMNGLSNVNGLTSANYIDPRFTTFFNTNPNNNGINRMGTSNYHPISLGLTNFNNQNFG